MRFIMKKQLSTVDIENTDGCTILYNFATIASVPITIVAKFFFFWHGSVAKLYKLVSQAKATVCHVLWRWRAGAGAGVAVGDAGAGARPPALPAGAPHQQLAR